MNATKRSMARAGLVAGSVLAVALTGCRTHVVHERTRTVYVAPPPVAYVPPATASPPPVVNVVPAHPPQLPPPVVVATTPAQSPVVVIESENDFYEPLAPHGRWVVVGSYGSCWIPARVEAGWRPYSNGYWQRTDAGWYWVSHEPWGWATYHYGRWDFHARFGWVWVPHTQWAPAWVSWREGGGYVGWAPLRPSVTIGVSLGAVEYEPAFASRAFVFVEHRQMLEPVRPKTVIVNNTTIINKTVNVTNVKVVNKTVINEGPRLEVIERASGRKVKAVPVHEFRHREEATVAARERNIPTASGRKVQRPAHTEPQPAPKQVVTLHNAQAVEKPVELQKPSAVVTPQAKPLVAPARPTPPQFDAGNPKRDETKRETEIASKGSASPRNVEPDVKSPTQRELRNEVKPAVASKPAPQRVTTNPDRTAEKTEAETVKQRTTKTSEVQAARAVPSQRERRPQEKPAAPTKTATQRVTTYPNHDERKHEARSEQMNPTTPPAVVGKPRSEVRPTTSSETAISVEPAPASPARIQTAPRREKPADKRRVASSEKSRAAEQPDANRKQEVSPRRKGDVQGAQPSASPGRPSP